MILCFRGWRREGGKKKQGRLCSRMEGSRKLK